MAETTSNDRICVSLLGSGWAAIHMVDVTDEFGTYADVQQTGVGRYKTEAEALAEAKVWSMSDGIPLESAISPAPASE